ncbi:MAG TPA: PRD domain-containing protein, partial [Lachnospiraceae bacterium]|nr:PRD domain-containing protein [Lachnospiraceae bacterium]
MYSVKKVVNNNIVCSVDENGREIILRGLGIGFQKRVNDTIEPEKIEKIYRLDNSDTLTKLQNLLADIPIEHVNTSTEIIEYAKEHLTNTLNENIYITLTDHISFAIERKKNQMEYKNALLWEIKNFYPKEFEIGQYALKVVKDRIGVELSEDEAGFITLHIVNAELNMKMSDMVNITEFIQDIVEIIKNYYHIDFPKKSLNYDRFITHIKFLGQRIIKKECIKDDDEQFQMIVKQRYFKDYRC